MMRGKIWTGKRCLTCRRATSMPMHWSVTSLRWGSHDSSWSKITPRFLTVAEHFSCWSMKRITGDSSILLSCRLSPHRMSSVFPAFTIIPFCVNQVPIVSRAVSRELHISEILFLGPVMAICVSSAYPTTLTRKPFISEGRQHDMSLLAILKSRGPKHDPWNVPIDMEWSVFNI